MKKAWLHSNHVILPLMHWFTAYFPALVLHADREET